MGNLFFCFLEYSIVSDTIDLVIILTCLEHFKLSTNTTLAPMAPAIHAGGVNPPTAAISIPTVEAITNPHLLDIDSEIIPVLVNIVESI